MATRFVRTTLNGDGPPGSSRPTSPVQSPKFRQDRAGAQSLKFGAKKHTVNGPAIQPSAYMLNEAMDRITHLDQQKVHQQWESGAPDSNRLETTSVESDFDITKSEVNFENDQQLLPDLYSDDDKQFGATEPQHIPHFDTYEQTVVLNAQKHHNKAFQRVQPPNRPHSVPLNHREHNEPALLEARLREEAKQRSQVTGRFDGHQMSIRPGPENIVEPHPGRASRKRTRSEEMPRNAKNEVHRNVNFVQPEAIAPVQDHNPTAGPSEQQDSENPMLLLQMNGHGHLEPSEDGFSDITVQSPTRPRKTRSSQPLMGHDSPMPADYPDEELKRMKYTEICAEDWDTDRHTAGKASFKLPDYLYGEKSTFADRMNHVVVSLPADKLGADLTPEEREAVREAVQDAQAAFFGNLSRDDWEDGGDWFIQKFTDLMQQLKQQRREKRVIAERYEKEIQKREKAVRGKSLNLDKQLKDMRASGEDMLKGKMS